MRVLKKWIVHSDTSPPCFLCIRGKNRTKNPLGALRVKLGYLCGKILMISYNLRSRRLTTESRRKWHKETQRNNFSVLSVHP